MPDPSSSGRPVNCSHCGGGAYSWIFADESIKIENTEIDAFFSLNSIHITPLVTPVISKSIDKVIKNYWICIK